MSNAERIAELCCGDREAMDFLGLWARYCHEIDDIVDGARTDKQAILSTFALAMMVYSHPFYLRNLMELRAIALMVGVLYGDSVAWEDENGWRKEFSKVYRHAANEMVLAVAVICGGYDHARSVAGEQRKVCFEAQQEGA